eukprot:9736228-Ditylum_brightwellii.AAC.1
MSLGPLDGGISSQCVGTSTEHASSYSAAKNANPAVAMKWALQERSKRKRLGGALSRLHHLNRTGRCVEPAW